MEFNWLQRDALKKLTLADNMPFKQLVGDTTDANLYSYHLKKLTKSGLISSMRGVYSLTPKGKHYVGSITIDTTTVRKQPKIVVMLYAVNSKGEYLLYRWKRQPYFNKVSLPYGKTHFDKCLEENVDHEAVMKLGQPILSKQYLGCFYHKIIESDVTLSHMLVHVYKVRIDQTGELVSKQSGEVFWSVTKTVSTAEFMPGFSDILLWIERKKSRNITELVSSI